MLARFYVAQEGAELERIEREFELQLARILRDPSDQGSRAQLASLRAQRELARARLDEGTVRAPEDGVVSDVRVRPGQHVSPGDVIATLVGPDARCTILAMLPGQYRPMLHPGTRLRVEMLGYRYAYRELTIDSIGDEVVGPAEVKRYLGPDLADAVPLSGPVVIVQAHLPGPTFVSGGRTYHYFDGMPATGEASVRSESILETLVPALKVLFEGHDG